MKHLLAFFLALFVTIAACARTFTTGNAFKEIESIKGFQTATIDKNSDYGYPDEFGLGVYTGYPNAEPRPKVEKIISKLPAEWMFFNQEEDGKFFRLYVERVDNYTLLLLIVMMGQGGNDTMVVWFPDVSTDVFDDYMNRHTRRPAIEN